MVPDLSPPEGSLGVGLVKRRMAQVQDETVGETVWEHDLVGCLKKERCRCIYPGKSISKVLKPTAGSGLCSEIHFTEMGLVCTVVHSDK